MLTVVLAVCALCALSFVVGVLLTMVVTSWRGGADTTGESAPPPVEPAAVPPRTEEAALELRWPGELSAGAVHRNPVVGVRPNLDPARGVPVARDRGPDSATSAPAQLRLVLPTASAAEDSLNEADVSGLRRRHLDTFEAPHHRDER